MMKSVSSKIISAVLAVIALVSCDKGGSVIPRNRMAEIYAEMFLADQWIMSHTEARRTADTTWVYEPIFEKYGYTSDDYRASVEYYLQDPDRYARILRKTSVIIEDRLSVLKSQKEMEESLQRLRSGISLYAPERIYFLTGLDNPGLLTEDSLTFYVDSAGGRFDFNPESWADTSYAGPVIVVSAADTLQDADAADTGSLSVKDNAGLKEDTGLKDNAGMAVPPKKTVPDGGLKPRPVPAGGPVKEKASEDLKVSSIRLDKKKNN